MRFWSLKIDFETKFRLIFFFNFRAVTTAHEGGATSWVTYYQRPGTVHVAEIIAYFRKFLRFLKKKLMILE